MFQLSSPVSTYAFVLGKSIVNQNLAIKQLHPNVHIERSCIEAFQPVSSMKANSEKLLGSNFDTGVGMKPKPQLSYCALSTQMFEPTSEMMPLRPLPPFQTKAYEQSPTYLKEPQSCRPEYTKPLLVLGSSTTSCLQQNHLGANFQSCKLPPLKPSKKNGFKRQLNVNKEKRAWSHTSTVLLLQCAKEMLHCELKEITKVVSIRLCDKHSGRAAEKKLKRLIGFENWRQCDKTKISEKIDEQLKRLRADSNLGDKKLLKMAKRIRPKLFPDEEDL